MRLVLSVYAATQLFPKLLYGLVSQMRRAAVSMPSNIAEGKGRLTDRDRAHFFAQSRGSLLELETQILIAAKLKYVSDATADSLLGVSNEVGRMLNFARRIDQAEKRKIHCMEVTIDLRLVSEV